MAKVTLKLLESRMEAIEQDILACEVNKKIVYEMHFMMLAIHSPLEVMRDSKNAPETDAVVGAELRKEFHQ